LFIHDVLSLSFLFKNGAFGHGLVPDLQQVCVTGFFANLLTDFLANLLTNFLANLVTDFLSNLLADFCANLLVDRGQPRICLMGRRQDFLTSLGLGFLRVLPFCGLGFMRASFMAGLRRFCS
jgi:hypothetical protein